MGKNNKCVRFFISRCQHFGIFKYRLLSISFSKKHLRIWNYVKFMLCWWLCKITDCRKDNRPYAKRWRRLFVYILDDYWLLITNSNYTRCLNCSCIPVISDSLSCFCYNFRACNTSNKELIKSCNIICSAEGNRELKEIFRRVSTVKAVYTIINPLYL